MSDRIRRGSRSGHARPALLGYLGSFLVLGTAAGFAIAAWVERVA